MLNKKNLKVSRLLDEFFRLNNVLVVSDVLTTANVDPCFRECIEISLKNLYVWLKGI